MPRVAEGRKPAAPVSERQTKRWDRILEAAASLGVQTGFDQVQMQEVAKAADVALGTLYRYFPSKEQLFGTLYRVQILRFIEEKWPEQPNGNPVEFVSDRLAELAEYLLAEPQLCASMVRATATAAFYTAEAGPQAPLTEPNLYEAVLHTLGQDDPDRDRSTAVVMLVHIWWTVLVSSLMGRTTDSELRYEIGLAARLLLAG